MEGISFHKMFCRKMESYFQVRFCHTLTLSCSCHEIIPKNIKQTQWPFAARLQFHGENWIGSRILVWNHGSFPSTGSERGGVIMEMGWLNCYSLVWLLYSSAAQIPAPNLISPGNSFQMQIRQKSLSEQHSVSLSQSLWWPISKSSDCEISKYLRR